MHFLEWADRVSQQAFSTNCFDKAFWPLLGLTVAYFGGHLLVWLWRHTG